MSLVIMQSKMIYSWTNINFMKEKKREKLILNLLKYFSIRHLIKNLKFLMIFKSIYNKKKLNFFEIYIKKIKKWMQIWI